MGGWHPFLYQPLLSFCRKHLPHTHRPLGFYGHHHACPNAPTLCTSLALNVFIASGGSLSPFVYGLGQAAYK